MSLNWSIRRQSSQASTADVFNVELSKKADLTEFVDRIPTVLPCDEAVRIQLDRVEMVTSEPQLLVEVMHRPRLVPPHAVFFHVLSAWKTPSDGLAFILRVSVKDWKVLACYGNHETC